MPAFAGMGGLIVLALGVGTASLHADPAFDWSGPYLGVHTGALFGVARVSDPYGTSIYGDDVRTPGAFLGAQAGYNWQASSWVYGLEGDISWLAAEGTATCFAFSGTFVSANCRVRPQIAATLAGRLGLTGDARGRTLYYLKAGAAALRSPIEATANYGFGAFPITTAGTSSTSFGWTVGVGIERAVAPAWSVKLEYDYLDFADARFTTAGGFTLSPGGSLTVVPPGTAHVDQSLHMIKLGLNYRIGADPAAKWTGDATAASAWALEVGARYWVSSGRFQKDLPAFTNSSTSLISRLTFADLSAQSGELYARLDSPWRFFVKGFAGLGRIGGGQLQDEDWGLVPTLAPFTSYSSTISNLTATKLDNFAADAGYDLIVGKDFKLGGYVGYTRINEEYTANDCRQVASPSSGICSPMITGVDVITETDKWSSLRLGLATEFWLTPRLKLATDVAFLPNVAFKGVDHHWLRALTIDESGRGIGTQIESILSYYFTPEFSVGLGGRYWAMWTQSGDDAFNGVPVGRSDTYRYERFGLLVQAAYKFQ